jgi:hypothetical protein
LEALGETVRQRKAQIGSPRFDPHQSAAHQDGLKPTPYGFDLGQLRHAAPPMDWKQRMNAWRSIAP